MHPASLHYNIRHKGTMKYCILGAFPVNGNERARARVHNSQNIDTHLLTSGTIVVTPLDYPDGSWSIGVNLKGSGVLG